MPTDLKIIKIGPQKSVNVGNSVLESNLVGDYRQAELSSLTLATG